MSKISIVIVNWNTADLLKKCLISLKTNLSKGLADVYVVDNASSDESVKSVKNDFPWVTLLANRKNLGFAAANNQALKRIMTEFVLFLNPDAYVTRGSVEGLVRFLEGNIEVGACGPLLLNTDGSIQKKGYYHRFPSLIQALLFYTEGYKIFRKSKFLVEKFWEHNFDKNSITEVDQIPGACLLIRATTLKKINYFDVNYPLWFEDVDLCFKLKKLGFKLFLVPKSKVFHLGGAAFNKWEDEVKKQTRFYKSLFLFFDKHKNIFSSFFIRLIIITNLLYLITTKSVKQFFTPTSDRKQFIRIRMEILKCLLV